MKQTSVKPIALKDLILQKYSKGMIVLSTIEGLRDTVLKDFIKQPIDGILYDLNRNEEVALTFIQDPKWVNDFAVCKVIRALKGELELEREKALRFAEWTSIEGFEYCTFIDGCFWLPINATNLGYERKTTEELYNSQEFEDYYNSLKK